MNNIRIARKLIEKQSDKILLGLWKVSKDDQSHEGITITYLIEAEMKKRNLKK